jgi:hypothetical protein
MSDGIAEPCIGAADAALESAAVPAVAPEEDMQPAANNGSSATMIVLRGLLFMIQLLD